jgi:hypothetical protein
MHAVANLGHTTQHWLSIGRRSRIVLAYSLQSGECQDKTTNIAEFNHALDQYKHNIFNLLKQYTSLLISLSTLDFLAVYEFEGDERG